jgi:hypothetical protein
MKQLYNKGTQLHFKDGTPAYEKVDDEAWGNWRSLMSELDKPLNDRTGFKYPDEQVFEKYKSTMKIVIIVDKSTSDNERGSREHLYDGVSENDWYGFAKEAKRRQEEDPNDIYPLMSYLSRKY